MNWYNFFLITHRLTPTCMVESIIQSTHYLFSYYVNKTIVIMSTDFLLKEIGDEKARTKSAPEPHIPAEPNALYTHTHASHIFSTHRAHVAFPVNVLSGRQRQRPRRSGVALEVAARKSRWRGGRGEWSLHAPVTATPWLSPTRLPPPPCKITLCRARWEITFCPSITGWIFGRRDPDHFERDTTPIWDVSGKGCRSNIVANYSLVFVTSRSIQ